MSRERQVSRAGLAALAVFALSIVLFAAWAPALRAAWSAERMANAYRGVLVGAGLLGLGAGVAALRRQPLRRLGGLLLVALLAALALRFGPGAGIGAGRLAEQTHLAQYGLLSLGWAWVFRRALRDGALYLTGILACGAVGLLDELVQWWVPERVGSLLDVRLDLVAAVLGQALAALVLFAGERPHGLGRESGALVLRASAVLVLAVGAFVHQVHLGHAIAVPEAGVLFRSRVSAQQLRARDAAWQPRPPAAGLATRLWRGEDFHLAEARYHAQTRNDSVRHGRLIFAAQHHAILGAYYRACLEALPELDVHDQLGVELARAAQLAPQAAYDAGPRSLTTRLDPLTWWLAVLALASGAALGAELLWLQRGAGDRG